MAKRLTTPLVVELNRLSDSLRYRQLMHELAHTLQAERLIRRRMTELLREYHLLRKQRLALIAEANRHFIRQDVAEHYGLVDPLVQAVGYCHGLLGLAQLDAYRAFQDTLAGRMGELIVLKYAQAYTGASGSSRADLAYVSYVYVARLAGEQLAVSRETVLPDVSADGWVCLGQTSQGGWTRLPGQAPNGMTYPPRRLPIEHMEYTVGTVAVLEFFVGESGPGHNWANVLGLETDQ